MSALRNQWANLDFTIKLSLLKHYIIIVSILGGERGGGGGGGEGREYFWLSATVVTDVG